jgi:hypothetical protein
MKIMGHAVIISSSAALRDTLSLDDVPGVSEYLFEYLVMFRARDKCYLNTPRELDAPPV